VFGSGSVPVDLEPVSVEDRPTKPNSRPARNLTLYAHLSDDAIVHLEGHGNPVVGLETLREWLNITGDVKVTIRPEAVERACRATGSRRCASVTPSGCTTPRPSMRMTWRSGPATISCAPASCPNCEGSE